MFHQSGCLFGGGHFYLIFENLYFSHCSQVNITTMKRLYTRLMVLSMALVLLASDGFGQKAILMVGRDVLGTYQSDQDLFDSLTAWGYAPEFWNSNGEYDVGTGPDFNPLDYSKYEAMFITEAVDSKAMARFATDGYPLPCVNLEGYAVATGNDRWAWLNDNGAELLQSAEGAATADDQIFVIKDNSHYITEVFNVGDEVAWSNSTVDVGLIRPVSIKEVNVTYSAKLGQMKSHAGSADFWNMVTVDAIGPSDNKMVFWGVNAVGLNGDAATTGSYGTPEFFTLIKRACAWAWDDAGSGVSVKTVQPDPLALVAYPNPASGEVTVRFSAPSAGQSTAILYNVAGQMVDRFQRRTVAGTNFLYLDAEQYPAGIYQLRVDLEEGSAVTKVVIQ